MLRLIIKDIVIQKRTFIFVFCYSIFTIFAFQSLKDGAFIATATASTYMLILTAAAYDDKCNCGVLLNSLPTNRKDIVSAKYISILVYAAFSVFSYWIVSTMLQLTGLPLKIYPVSLFGTATMLVVVSILASIYLPVILKFGYIKAKLFNLIFFALLFIVPTLAINFFKRYVDKETIENLGNLLANPVTEWKVSFYMIGAALAFTLASYILSVRIYQKREF